MWSALLGIARSWRLIVVAITVGFSAGAVVSWQLRGLAESVRTTRAINEERARQEASFEISIAAERRALTAMQTRAKRAEGLVNDLRRRLQDVPDCRVPAPVVGLFNDSTLPAAPGGPARPDGPARADDAAQCRDLLAVCVANQSGACADNEARLGRWQEFYEQLRKQRQ